MSVRAGLALALLVALTVLGGLAYHHQLVVGDVATGLGTLGAGGAVWGLYIVADGVLLGAGVATMACACLARFSRDREMEAVARIAMPVALACFVAAALCVLADQGRPASALADLAHFARPESPFFATFTGVAVCLVGGAVHWVLALRPDLAVYAQRPSRWQPLQRLLAAGYRGSAAERYRRQQTSFWMSLLLLALLVVPFAALAIIFTVRPGRPLLLVVEAAIAFTVSSAAGGLALLILTAAWVGRIAGPRAGIGTRGCARLGRGLLFVDALAVLAAVGGELAGLASGDAAAEAMAAAMRGRAYGTLFFGELGLFFLAAAMLWLAAWRGRLGWRTASVASVLSAGAVCLEHHLGLVAWQTHGLLLPYRPGVYSPSGTEIAVLLGIVAFSGLLLLPAVRLLPFAPAVFDQRPGAKPPAGRGRVLLTGLWLAAGLALVAVGLLLCLRVGTLPFLDPVVPGSPVLFIVGLAVLLTAGAVYELLPDRATGAGASEPAIAPPPPA